MKDWIYRHIHYIIGNTFIPKNTTAVAESHVRQLYQRKNPSRCFTVITFQMILCDAFLANHRPDLAKDLAEVVLASVPTPSLEVNSILRLAEWDMEKAQAKADQLQ